MPKIRDPKIAKRNNDIRKEYEKLTKGKPYGTGQEAKRVLAAKYGVGFDQIRKIVYKTDGSRLITSVVSESAEAMAKPIDPKTFKWFSMVELNEVGKAMVVNLEAIKAEIRTRQDKNLFD